MDIIDPHHRPWDHGRHSYPWPSDTPIKAVFGPCDAIRRDDLVGNAERIGRI